MFPECPVEQNSHRRLHRVSRSNRIWTEGQARSLRSFFPILVSLNRQLLHDLANTRKAVLESCVTAFPKTFLGYIFKHASP
jgi:hypothetical protein